MVDHSLDYPATILMLGKLDAIFFDFSDEDSKGLRFIFLTHVDENFLDDVVSAKMQRALHDVVIVIHLAQHRVLLLCAEHLERSLDDPATVLMDGKFTNTTFQMFIYDLKVMFLRICAIELDSLNNVVPILILDQFTEINRRVFEQLVVEPFLLLRIYRKSQSLLDETRALLVQGAK